MTEEVANAVFPIFAEGLRLKESLASEEPPDFLQSQKDIKGMIQAASQVQRWAQFGSTSGDPPSSVRFDQFLGMKYALVCWLDEIFLADDSPWKKEWEANILEQTFFGTRDRAWRFWEQWRRAGGQSGTDSLEVYYLCVILGFRGDLQDQPGELEKRVEAAKAQLDKDLKREFPAPVPGQPPTAPLPDLKGARRLQRMLMLAGALVLLAIPVAVVYLILRP